MTDLVGIIYEKYQGCKKGFTTNWGFLKIFYGNPEKTFKKTIIFKTFSYVFSTRP